MKSPRRLPVKGFYCGVALRVEVRQEIFVELRVCGKDRGFFDRPLPAIESGDRAASPNDDGHRSCHVFWLQRRGKIEIPSLSSISDRNRRQPHGSRSHAVSASYSMVVLFQFFCDGYYGSSILFPSVIPADCLIAYGAVRNMHLCWFHTRVVGGVQCWFSGLSNPDSSFTSTACFKVWREDDS